MNLRRQLMIVSLLLLVLPWAGYQYIAQIGGVMMDGEVEAQQAKAETVIAYLQSRPELFRDLIQTDISTRQHIPVLDRSPLIDGFLRDWPGFASAVLAGELSAQAAALRVGDTLYLGIRVQGSTPDILSVHLLNADSPIALQLRPSGEILALRARDSEEMEVVSSALGRWVRSTAQLSLEIAFPISLVGDRFGLQLRSGEAAVNWGLDSAGQPIRWIADQPQISAGLRIFRDVGTRYSLLSIDGLEVAATGAIAADQSLAGWTRWAARLLPVEAQLERDAGEAPSAPLWILQDGTPRLEMQLPVQIGGLLVGWLGVQTELGGFLEIYSGLLRQWTLASLALFVLVSLGLLTYASWLSWRIRQLSRWTRGLIDDHGRVDESFAPSPATDEIGELSRDYAALTQRLQKHTQYLQGLAGRLSHEIRTPLAIIGSSLENLESSGNPDERQVYIERARQGIERLRRMLRRMSEASTLEAGIEQTPRQNFDPDQLVMELAQSYRQTFGEGKVRYERLPETARARLNGSPDLLAQLVDKLVENALSFARSGTEVVVESGFRRDGWEMRVSNLGSLLPVGAEQDIFTSMVSLRPADKTAEGHLGLGLTIVRRIAEFHGGSVSARNLPNGEGVVFELNLPRTSS